jgi:hypothetical protein
MSIRFNVFTTKACLAHNLFYPHREVDFQAAKTSTRRREQDMNRIAQLDPAQATGKTKQLFDNVHAKLGVVPNLFRVLGNAPAALEGYLTLSGALAGGSLNASVREQIAHRRRKQHVQLLLERAYASGSLNRTDSERDRRCDSRRRGHRED